MKAARMHVYKQPLILEDVPTPDIQADEILVKVGAAGMCRTDVQLLDGYFRRYADLTLPLTPGHEIAGVVDKIGVRVPKSAGFEKGDQVVVVGGWSDGTCRHCQAGNTHIWALAGLRAFMAATRSSCPSRRAILLRWISV